MKRATMTTLLALSCSAALAAVVPDAQQELREALMAEWRRDWEASLRHYETIYDSTATDEISRSALRKTFAELRQKAPPNKYTGNAGRWKVKAYAFRELDFRWRGTDGRERRGHWRMRGDEIEFIRSSLNAFADRVWDYSSGSLNIVWDLTVIEQPLTRLDGRGSYWPGPRACMPYLSGLKTNEASTIMVYAKLRGEPGEHGEPVPMAVLGGSFGVLRDTKGATYTGINMGGGLVKNEPRGEVELHEWLHAAQWTLEAYQCYPTGLMFSPNGGRREGEAGGDPCYRRTTAEAGWVGYYRHLMQAHVTRKMWRELSVSVTPDNVWIGQCARRALVLGPFSTAGYAWLGLDAPFIDEANVRPQAGSKAGDRMWQPITSANRTLNITPVLGAGRNQVCYLAVWAQSETEQRAQARVGSDDGCRVWQNGNVILSSPWPRPLVPDKDIADITLKRGRNLFLVKVTNSGGAWCATFRLTAPNGGPLPGVSYVE